MPDHYLSRCDISSSNRECCAVYMYSQSPSDCLQFVHPEETEVNVTDLVIVDLDELTVSSSMIEVTDEAYHMIVDHRNRDAELQIHDTEPEVTAQDDGVIIRSRRLRKVMEPARFRE